MAFDIHEEFHEREGWLSEEHAGRYEESLIDLFAESAEGKELLETEEDLGWAALQIRMGIAAESLPGHPPRRGWQLGQRLSQGPQSRPQGEAQGGKDQSQEEPAEEVSSELCPAFCGQRIVIG